MIGTTISHYKILEKLGEGGMGIVFKAEDTRLKRTVALKFLPRGLESHEAERARFLQEAQAASALNHPNVCTIYDIGEAEGQRFIAMEYVQGMTLREKIAEGRLQTGTAVGYAIQIAEALEEAHSKGIVHRDMKADNIMVNTKNQVKVMDFGLAKLKGSLKLTKTSSTIGTLAYMAPEQIEGGEVDARSDIFSFGIVLYEMLTGHLPFRGEHEAAMVYSIVNDEPEPLQHYVPEAPSELLHILDRALEKDREERYQTVHDMLIDLRRLKKDSTRVSRQPHGYTPMPGTAMPEPTREGKKGWRKQLWLVFVGVALLCVISVLLLLSRTSPVRLNPNRITATVKIPFKEVQYPSLSRDGNWLAFAAKDEKQRYDVYMMNLSGGEPHRVTDESAWWMETVDISPDVGQIVYHSVRESDQDFAVRIVPSQGGVSRTLADSGFMAKWRPDGQRIGYLREVRQARRRSERLELWSVRADGTDNRLEFIDSANARLAPAAFCWSPDGTSITWVHNFPGGYGEVMVRELATGKERQLTSDKKTVDEVIWTSNGQILFVSNKSGPTNLWMIPSGGGEAIQVTQGAVPIFGSRISADSKSLVYMQEEDIAHIWTSFIDGSNARQITTADVRATAARISPDGKHIAFISRDIDVFNQEAHLYIMDRDGKNQRLLSSGSEIVTAIRWSPDCKWLAYSSKAIGEPEDSNRVYVIQPLNPGSPRMLCKGYCWWIDNESLVVFDQMKTSRYSIKGGTGSQVYEDSTFAVPLYASSSLVFFDFREGRNDWYVVAVDSLGMQKGGARRICPSKAINIAYSHDLRCFVYRRGDELWRVWTSTRKEEKVAESLPLSANMTDVSMDGREILWIKTENRSKLVLVKNVFE
jgi:eukaryotic-like serine/threonine-protein kinase